MKSVILESNYIIILIYSVLTYIYLILNELVNKALKIRSLILECGKKVKAMIVAADEQFDNVLPVFSNILSEFNNILPVFRLG